MDSPWRIVPAFIPMLGCRHQCVFCNQHVVTAQPGADIGAIRAQLEAGMSHVNTERPADEIAFFGGSFTCLTEPEQRSILSLAAPYLEQGRAKGLRISTRPDYIGEENLALLKEAHVHTIELGIQSTNDDVLSRSGRGHTAQEIRQAAEVIQAHGFALGLQMMVGLPGDTPKIARQTARDMVHLAPDFVRIYPTLILRGSPLEALYTAGHYQPLGLEEAVAMVSELKLFFTYHNIPVIRTGLQANEGLDTGAGCLAGPYHPAFGELVDGEGYLAWFTAILNRHLPSSARRVCFRVPARSLSKALGQRRRNLERLKGAYPDHSIAIEGAQGLPAHQLQTVWDGGERDFSLEDFLAEIYGNW